jgi:hypothetical protein
MIMSGEVPKEGEWNPDFLPPTEEQRQEVLEYISLHTQDRLGQIIVSHTERLGENAYLSIYRIARGMIENNQIRKLTPDEAFYTQEFQELVDKDPSGTPLDLERQKKLLLQDYDKTEIALIIDDTQFDISIHPNNTVTYSLISLDTQLYETEKSERETIYREALGLNVMNRLQLELGKDIVELALGYRDDPDRLRTMRLLRDMIMDPLQYEELLQELGYLSGEEMALPHEQEVGTLLSLANTLAARKPGVYVVRSRPLFTQDTHGRIASSHIISGPKPDNHILHEIEIVQAAPPDSSYDHKRAILYMHQSGDLFYTEGFFFDLYKVHLRQEGILPPMPDQTANDSLEAMAANVTVREAMHMAVKAGEHKALRQDTESMLTFLRNAQSGSK